MTSSQHHGFDVEARLLAEFDRRAALPGFKPPVVQTAHVARFDVAAHRDPYGQGVPSSIKTSKYKGPKTLVCMADATRIAGLTEVPRMRLLVALYQQKGDQKVFSEIREYLIDGEEWKGLMGHVPAEHIEAFNLSLRRRTPEQARTVAKQWRARLAEEYPSAIKWNAKIDSKNQRRLQCSVTLEDLEAAIVDKSRIRVFGTSTDPKGSARPAYLRPVSKRMWFDGFPVPFALASTPRVRRAKPPPVLPALADGAIAEPMASPKAKRPGPR